MTDFGWVYLFIAAVWWPVFAYHLLDDARPMLASLLGLYCSAIWPASVAIWAMASWVVMMKGGR